MDFWKYQDLNDEFDLMKDEMSKNNTLIGEYRVKLTSMSNLLNEYEILKKELDIKSKSMDKLESVNQSNKAKIS